MILHSLQDIENSPDVGGKTKNLARLQRSGFAVPEFVAIPATVLSSFAKSSPFVREWDLRPLVQEIRTILPTDYYAVRSSALIEDGSHFSHAGQFMTRIEVPPEQLEKSLQDVIAQAFDYLKGEIEKFSLIIQRYISPDIAGVTFTRHPDGGRQMVMEYHDGKGESVVSGAITPTRQSLYWHQSVKEVRLPSFDDAFSSFKKIEELFGFAQDIEWAVKDGRWYFLQSRPITTLSRQKYDEAVFLDRHLPHDQDFHLEKTEIAEIAPRPSTMTRSLLEKIYGSDGPVQHVYRKYGIRFSPRSFLRIIGNELFVDRDLELMTLLPAYRSSGGDYRPRVAFLGGIPRTAWNMLKLSLVSTKHKEHLVKQLVDSLEKTPAETFEKACEDFLKDYRLIFEINFLAQKAVSRLQATLALSVMKDPDCPTVADILSASRIAAMEETFLEMPKSVLTEGWLGNSLEISDVTPFHRTYNHEASPYLSEKISMWLVKRSSWHNEAFLAVVARARFFHRLREGGRWLTVRHIHHLRMLLTTIAEKISLPDTADIFFATPEEVDAGTLDLKVLAQRRADFAYYHRFNFPSRLTGSYVPEQRMALGVSPGRTEGVLTNREGLTSVTDPILFTPLLSPDLTVYFPRLKGIVSEQGGLLSHLAIVARENRMPVVVNVSLDRLGLTIGDRISIDGSSGEIRKL